MIKDIAKAEHETDELQVTVRRALFNIENTLPPVDVMFLYEVISLTGKIADRAEQVGNRLHLLLAR
jgi:predicted phosphate transport protein (TIGR00153 family)